MTDDGAPRSAYELAMERLRKKDAEAGIAQQTLSEAQRAAIAEARNFYASDLARTFDPDARAALEQNYRRDRERLTSERDEKIERIRKGDT
jgi:hypothetical protein